MIKYSQLPGVKNFKSSEEALEHITKELVKSHDAAHNNVLSDLKKSRGEIKHTPKGVRGSKNK